MSKPQRHEKTEELSKIGGDKEDMTRGTMWDPRLDPGPETKHYWETVKF